MNSELYYVKRLVSVFGTTFLNRRKNKQSAENQYIAHFSIGKPKALKSSNFI